MLSFYTLFPNIEDVHLIKDVGQIPEHLASIYTLSPVIITTNSKISLSENNSINKTKIMTIKSRAINKYIDLGILNYLFQNRKSISILNLYHFEPRSFFAAFAYKLFNPKGRIYLKLDNDLRSIESEKTLYHYGSTISRLFFKRPPGAFAIRTRSAATRDAG